MVSNSEGYPSNQFFPNEAAGLAVVYTSVVRAIALTLGIFLLLVPQLVCFLPAADATPSESECCQHMTGDCGDANMQGNACCPSNVQPSIAITTQIQRHVVPYSAPATDHIAQTVGMPGTVLKSVIPVQGDSHGPPDDPLISSSVLRI
jgi:hypothetical protein